MPRTRGGEAPPPRSTPALRDLHERLAAVLAAEHPHERGRGVLEPLRHVLAPTDLPLGDPPRESYGRLVEAVRVVGDEEALHPRAEDDQEAREERRIRALEVVLRDLPADDDPRADVQPPVHRA